MKKVLFALALLLASGAAEAQWQVPLGSVPVGRGPGVQGFGSVAPGANNNCLTVSGGLWVSAPCPGAAGSGVSSLGGAVGTITLGSGLSIPGNVLTYTQPPLVNSLGGSTGALTLGSGLSIPGGVLTYKQPGFVSPLDYGALCDGSTHDEVAFQNALNAAIAGNLVLRIPPAVNCVLNANITDGTALFSNIIIAGAGQTSRITFLGNFGFTFNAQASYYLLQDFYISCQSTSPNPCIKIFHATQSTAAGSIIQRLRIACSFYCLYFQNMVQTKVLNNVLLTAHAGGFSGLYVDNTATADVGGNLVQGNLIINVAGVTSYGMYLLNFGGSVVSYNQLSGYSYDIYVALAIASGASTGLQIQNNQLDNFTTAGIWFTNTLTTGALLHASIANNVLHATTTGGAGSYGIAIAAGAATVAWVANLSITGNTVDVYQASAGIVVLNSTNFAVTGNVITDQGVPVGAGIATNVPGSNCTIVGNTVNTSFAVHVQNGTGCTVAGNN